MTQPCALLVLPSLPGHQLWRGCQGHSQMESRAKAAGFWLLSHLDTEQGQRKTHIGSQLPCLKLNYPMWAVSRYGAVSDNMVQKQQLPKQHNNLCPYFHLQFHSPTSYKLLSIKKGSTFPPDLKAYDLSG